MTKHYKAEKVRRELLSRGYSPSYVDRLIDELHDHRCQIVENGNGHNSRGKDGGTAHADVQLGVNSAFLNLLDHYPELRPWPQRHPLWTFIVFPGAALCLISALSISGAELIAQQAMFGNSDLNQLAFTSHRSMTVLVFALLAMFFAWTAVRSRVPWSFLVTSLSLISLNGFFVTELAHCQQSETSIAYSHIGFDYWRTLVPIFICLLGVVIARTKHVPVVSIGAGFGATTDRCRPGWRSITSVRILPAILLVSIVAVLFFLCAAITAKVAKPHAANKFVSGMHSESRTARDTLALFSLDSVNTELGTTEQQQTINKNAVLEWECFNLIQQANHFPNPPTPLEFRKFELSVLRPELLQVEKRMLALLDQDQKKRLKQIRNQYVRNDVFFLMEVRRELRISPRQFRSIKDLYVERIRRDARWNRNRRKGPDANKNLVEPDAWHNQEIVEILTESQLERLQKMRGKPVNLAM